MSTIEERISQLREEARSLLSSLSIVALKLGIKYPKKHGSNFVYDREGIIIIVDTYASNLSVSYKGDRVLTLHLGTITGFVKGPWVETVQELAVPLMAAKKAEKEAKIRRERAESLLKNWGLIE